MNLCNCQHRLPSKMVVPLRHMAFFQLMLASVIIFKTHYVTLLHHINKWPFNLNIVMANGRFNVIGTFTQYLFNLQINNFKKIIRFLFFYELFIRLHFPSIAIEFSDPNGNCLETFVNVC
jgi:hypothetical protein